MKRIWLRTTVRMVAGVLLGLLLAAVWMGDHPGVADAQTTTGLPEIPFTVQGKISREGERVIYNFAGQRGEVVTIRLNRISSSLDPLVELWTRLPQDKRLAYDDDGGGNANSLIAGYPLPVTGPYRVVARAYRGTGSFELIVSSNSNTVCGGVIQFGSQVIDQNVSSGQKCTFTFAAVYSAAVNVKMEKRSGDLDPYLELYDPSGRLVASDDDSAGNYNAQISNYVLLSKNGNYMIVARSYGSGQSGSFRLTLWAW